MNREIGNGILKISVILRRRISLVGFAKGKPKATFLDPQKNKVRSLFYRNLERLKENLKHMKRVVYVNICSYVDTAYIVGNLHAYYRKLIFLSSWPVALDVVHQLLDFKA